MGAARSLRRRPRRRQHRTAAAQIKGVAKAGVCAVAACIMAARISASGGSICSAGAHQWRAIACIGIFVKGDSAMKNAWRRNVGSVTAASQYLWRGVAAAAKCRAISNQLIYPANLVGPSAYTSVASENEAETQAASYNELPQTIRRARKRRPGARLARSEGGSGRGDWHLAQATAMLRAAASWAVFIVSEGGYCQKPWRRILALAEGCSPTGNAVVEKCRWLSGPADLADAGVWRASG